jgi:ATP-independent RNA helicase DbpA
LNDTTQVEVHLTKFSELELSKELVSNLESLNYLSMTQIQAESLPHILDGKDVIAQAKTGSGKTAAFGLGLLEKLEVKRFRIQSIVLCPTRELADQVANEIRRLARSIHNIKVLTLCGGKPFGPQIGSLEHGAHIIVGTPGRIEEHIRKGSLALENVSMFVLDEADRMLEMGFQEALEKIAEAMPAKKQTLLFSATFPKGIEKIAHKFLQDPVRITVEEAHTQTTIKQLFYKVKSDEEKIQALHLLLQKSQPESTVVFCNTKVMTQYVADELSRLGFSALALNGDLEQRDRDQVLMRFSSKAISIIVATDVAARGLDIDGLDVVVNFELSRDPEVHVHRIGRTGRAGESGTAYSFYGDNDSYKISLISDEFKLDIKPSLLPDISVLSKLTFRPKMACIQIDGGKKDKLRPGDILGALTSTNSIQADQIGKIAVYPNTAYVAVDRTVLKLALALFTDGKMKGKRFRVRHLR